MSTRVVESRATGEGAVARWTLRRVIAADLHRHGARAARAPVREFFRNYSFRFMVVLRCCQALRARRALYPLFVLLTLAYARMSRRWGISISVGCRIGPGFYIGHFGGIVVHGDAVIGANCNISQGVTIGETPRGPRRGVPTLGDEVYIGPGAKIIGRIRVGDRVAVGANAVVTRDVPDDGVAIGIPAHVASLQGSRGYIQDPAPL